MMILISDGEENRRPYVAEVMPRLRSRTVELNSIVISDEADKEYVRVSNDLRGSAHYTPDVNEVYRALRTVMLKGYNGLPGDRLQEVR